MAKTATQTTDIATEEEESAAALPPAEEKLGFFEYIQGLSSTDWQKHFAYVYRLAPITDRLAAGGETKYIRKYAAPFDEERIKHDDGSGRYRILLNKIHQTSGRSKTIKRIEFDIEDTAYPPKVPESEWRTDARNERWAWARKPSEPEPSDPGAQTMRMVRDIIKEMRPNIDPQNEKSLTTAVLDAVKETRAEMSAAADPTKTVNMLKELVTLFMPKEKAGDADGGVMKQMLTLFSTQLTDLRTELAEERKFNREILAKRHNGNSDAGGDGESKGLRKILDTALAGMLQEKLTGGASNAPEDWKQTGMRIFGEQLPEVLGLAKTYFAAQSTQSYRTAAPAPGTPATRMNPQSPATPAAAATAATPPENNMPTPSAVPGLSPMQNRLRDMFLQYGKTLVVKFRAGMPGGDFADLIVLASGSDDYEAIRGLGRRKEDGTTDETIKPEVTREEILAVLRTIPEMWSDLTAVSGVPDKLLPELATFLDEFIDPPGDDEPPPPPKKAAAKGGKKK